MASYPPAVETQEKEDTSMPYLWAPVVAASFLFSVYWLAKAALLFQPQLRLKLTRLATCGAAGRPKKVKAPPSERLPSAELDVEQQFTGNHGAELLDNGGAAMLPPAVAAAPPAARPAAGAMPSKPSLKARDRTAAAGSPIAAGIPAAGSQRSSAAGSPAHAARKGTASVRFGAQSEIRTVEPAIPPAGGFGGTGDLSACGSDNEDQEGEIRTVARRKSSMAPPVPPTTIQWDDICYRVATPSGDRYILRDITGVARPYELHALLGPSGAGKSTLMDILAVRKAIGSYTGSVLVNGEPAASQFVRTQSAYVPQFDNFIPTMTVREVLTFYARTILPTHYSRESRNNKVESVMETMGLWAQADTLVGGVLPGGISLRGLSGGERKRLNIASGVLARPPVVFLDEPTSGLDSFAALTVMKYLKRKAAVGHTIVASIHQPRAAIWGMFDKVTLLSEGLLIYTGDAAAMADWFGRSGFLYAPEAHGPVTDWVLDLVTVGFEKASAVEDEGEAAGERLQAVRRKHTEFTISSKEELEELAARFKADYPERKASGSLPSGSAGALPVTTGFLPGNNGDCGAVRRWPAGPVAGGASEDAVVPAEAGVATAVRMKALNQEQGSFPGGSSLQQAEGLGGALALWWQQFRALYWREMLWITRNPTDVAGRMLVFLLVAVLASLLGYSLPDTAESIFRRVIILFTVISIYMLMPYLFMTLFVQDKRFYLQDAGSRLYPTSAYYISKVLATVPFNVAIALTFILVIYGMVGLRHSAVAVVQVSVVSVLMSLVSLQFLSFAALVTPSQDFAFMLTILWTALSLLISNFFIRFREMNLYGLSRLRYLSAMYWAYSGAINAELRGRTFTCADGGGTGVDSFGIPAEVIPDQPAAVGYFKTLIGSKQPAGCIAEGDAVLEFNEVDPNFGLYAGALASYLVIMHIVTYTSLVVMTRRQRASA